MKLRNQTLLFALTLSVGLYGCDETSPEVDAGPLTDSGQTDGGQTDAGPPDEDAGTQSNTIVDVALGSDDFTTLVAALQRADLVTTLQGAGPFTVFAPTNAAFAASGITDVDAVDVDDLTEILLYHVVPSEVPSTAITAGAVDTAAELSIILGTEGGVTLNGGNAIDGGANVTTADVEADNGVIHIVDRVLLPPDITDLTRYAGLTELGAALTSENLVTTLQGEGPFTVFAPTNDAFPDTAPAGLADILLYHVVSGEVLSGAVPGSAPSLSTVSYEDGGETRAIPMTLFFDTSSGVVINGGAGTDPGNLGATVAIADVRATNGVVHVIDGTLIPLNIAQVATVAGFTSLVAAVGASDPIPASIAGTDTPVIDALAMNTFAPLTVFAPTDAAFAAAFPGGVPSDGAALLGVLALHVVNLTLPVRAEDIPATPVAPLAGSDLTFDTAATPPTVTVSGGGTTADISATDIGASNGIVHVIDSVLLESGS